MKLAKLANDAGDYVPVWAVGLGFEAMIESECPNAERLDVKTLNTSK